jgi:hypothetical protein
MTANSGHELATGRHPHIESHHDSSETLFCLVHNGECGVTVDILASSEEQSKLETAIMAAIERLDDFFDGKFAELFRGLEVQVGDGLTESGGEAFGDQNRIVLDRQKMLLTLREEDALYAQNGFADEGDRMRAVGEEAYDMSAAYYELIHEVGHILEERADLHLPKHERLHRADGLAAKSPTQLYNQDPEKPHEAFAEAFAYMVLGNTIDHELTVVVDCAIEDLKN